MKSRDCNKKSTSTDRDYSAKRTQLTQLNYPISISPILFFFSFELIHIIKENANTNSLFINRIIRGKPSKQPSREISLSNVCFQQTSYLVNKFQGVGVNINNLFEKCNSIINKIHIELNH